ncbi:HlyD family secretion protein [Paraburkholderia metrosideri]|uniref:Colistin resistance protein EmrA n=1 Tax=Paraburkholderia metrosideri TaxID=580937 RepID=A0ABN7I4A0_9BURK|nr:HlyD family secretion protein [Paraburkholderia metrosideri]CAD6547008.1 Colistin resistance protein EmrA [Paraburkholderia metrosideri]
MSTTVAPEKRTIPGRKHLIAAAVVVVAVTAAVAGVRWWTVGRFIESTDDAYVRADVVTMSSHVPGYVSEVAVQDDQPVRAGDVLIRIDDRDYQAKVDHAEATVSAALAAIHEQEAGAASLDAQVAQQSSLIAQAQADVAAARADAVRRDADAGRYRELYAQQASSGQRLELARADQQKAAAVLAKASAAVQSQRDQQDVLRRRREQSLAGIERANAQLSEARSALALAQLDLQHTVIRATRDGVIGQRTVRPGQYVETGMPLLAVVPLNDVYVVANFKETQLGDMHTGQPVQIDIDTYSGHTLRGKVTSIAPGSGAEFALLPPDNATGNFTKVVQRIPVRIRFDASREDARRLRAGMSVVVRVDTRNADGGQPS